MAPLFLGVIEPDEEDADEADEAATVAASAAAVAAADEIAQAHMVLPEGAADGKGPSVGTDGS